MALRSIFAGKLIAFVPYNAKTHNLIATKRVNSQMIDTYKYFIFQGCAKCCHLLCSIRTNARDAGREHGIKYG